MRNAALLRGLAPLTDTTELGMLLENFVVAHVHALATHEGVRLFHWREGAHEVDLVYDHPDQPLVFEIASSRDHSRRGLLHLVQSHPRFSGRCWIVAPDAETVPPAEAADGIGTIAVDLFLVLVGRQAERAWATKLGGAMAQ